MIRVVVADDEALVRDGLRAIAELEGDIEVIAEAATGDQAVALARQLRPDVVLMDVRMPGLDGIQATRRVLAEPDPPRVLVLTTFDRNHYVYEALKAGASGFLLKDVRRGQLTRAIRDVVAGETLLAPAITLRLIEQFCPAAGAARRNPGRPGRTHAARSRGAATARPGPVQHPDRERARRRRDHREDSRGAHPGQARPA